MIKHFTKNLVGNDYVVGDIHGCFTLFEEKLSEIGFNTETDRMFSVGDLIDRGPECYRVGEFLDKSWFFSVLGNHEQMAIDFIEKGANIYVHPQNGGNWVLDQEDGIELLKSWIPKFKQLPLVIEVETAKGLVGIIHAECPKSNWVDISLINLNNEYIKNYCIWSRQLIESSNKRTVRGIHKVYHGHTPTNEVVELGNRMYIDTGAVFKQGSLTIIKL